MFVRAGISLEVLARYLPEVHQRAPNTGAAQVLAQRLVQTTEGPPRSRVGGRPRPRHDRGRRTHVDDETLLLGHHAFDERTADIGRREIGRTHHLDDLPDRCFLEESPLAGACAVDDQRRFTPLGADPLSHRHNGGAIGGIERLGHRLATGSGDIFHQLGEALGTPSDHHHPPAVACECRRGCRTDSAGGSCDDCNRLICSTHTARLQHLGGERF